MKDGTKFNLTYLISQEERMAQIILKRSEYRFMQIAELEEYIFQTGSIQRKNFHQSSSSFCLIRLTFKKYHHFFRNKINNNNEKSLGNKIFNNKIL